MAEERRIFPEGWTERVRTQLFADGAAIDLTGKSISMLVYDKFDRLFTPTGTAGVDTALTGIVYFDPAATDIAYSRAPMHVEWRVTTSGRHATYPRDQGVRWDVRRP